MPFAVMCDSAAGEVPIPECNNQKDVASTGEGGYVESMHATLGPCPLVSCFLFNTSFYIM